MEFLKENLATIIVSIVVFGLLLWIIVAMIRRRIHKKSMCLSGCSMCPFAQSCTQEHSNIQQSNGN